MLYKQAANPKRSG